ncbi:uncharacterized protein LOC120345807 [Styela clava]|uniref:uncharacterized protein LOC120345807 n=1 Tax=Styela clava TaxID=7725 RepID=UPI00193A1063|nr:uncharacterized protein LOC120345807 [Styela clava]XP_039271293.1 uncharacterized protein LOC120345807 [Styela clava]
MDKSDYNQQNNTIHCDEEDINRNAYIAILSAMESMSVLLMINFTLFLAYSRKRPGGPRLHFSDVHRKVLHISLLIMIGMINLRLIIEIINLALGRMFTDDENVVFIVKLLFGVICDSCLYTFLWLRQWTLYNQPMLQEQKTTKFKVVNVLVWIIGICLVGAMPGILIWYRGSREHEEGCLFEKNGWGIAYVIHSLFSIVYEILLLGFFVYLVMRTRSQSQKKAVPAIIKRSLGSALLCFACVVCFAFIHKLAIASATLNSVTTDLEYLIYYCCLVASYNDWKEKMLGKLFIKSGYKNEPGSFSSKSRRVKISLRKNETE